MSCVLVKADDFVRCVPTMNALLDVIHITPVHERDACVHERDAHILLRVVDFVDVESELYSFLPDR